MYVKKGMFCVLNHDFGEIEDVKYFWFISF